MSDMWPSALLAATALALSAGPIPAQEAPPALITQAQADCLAAQADAYLAENRPVYVVVVPPEDSCPNPPSKNLADKSTASGAGIGLKAGNSSGFIVMTYAQLTCVKSHLADILKADAQSPEKFYLSLQDCPK